MRGYGRLPHRYIRAWITGLVLFTLLGAAPAQNPRARSSARGDLQTSSLQVPILAYHYISPDLPPAGLEEYYLTPGQFAAQLDVIRAHGYTTVRLEDLALYRGDPLAHPLPARPVVITFDDGFQNNYTYAIPALQSRGMTAAFFIVTGLIQDSDSQRCAPNWDAVQSCFMTWSEIQAIHVQGFEIGAHTSTHPDLVSLYAAQPLAAEAEIAGSRQALQDHLGAGTVHFFAYPYGLGAGDAGVEQLVADAGYQGAVSYGDPDRPADPLVDDLFALPRLAIQREHTLELDVSNPYWFFPTRLDPAFALPDIAFSGVQAAGSNRLPRSQFYPGEPVTVTVDAVNYSQSQDVLGRLILANGLGASYDSRLAQPSADVLAAPFPGGPDGEHFLFSYPWVIPTGAQSLGSYAFQWAANDPPSGLLQYYRYDSTPAEVSAFEVVAKPIRLEVDPPRLPRFRGQSLTLTFTAAVGPAFTAAGAYLTVSLSDHLAVTGHTATQGSWSQVAEVVMKDGTHAPAQFLTFEMSDADFGAGAQTYTLTVQALPGFSSQDWLKYRLSMRMDQPTLPTGDEYLRDPLSGALDQQDYYAFRIEGLDSLEFFLPVVGR